jgi:hypothetical protein
MGNEGLFPSLGARFTNLGGHNLIESYRGAYNMRLQIGINS